MRFNTLSPSETLSEWAEMLDQEDINEWALQNLARLASQSLMGRAEATKIMVHLFRRNSGPHLKDPSRYLAKALRKERTSEPQMQKQTSK